MKRKPTAQDCADLAMAEAEGDLIPYVLGKETLSGEGADCQGLIEATIQALGGEMSYRGSNDMFRNACSYVETLDQAKQYGRLIPGAVLFIVRQDGGEPPQYRDNKGNASHVGWYTGGRYEVVHASSSKGKVAPSTLRNAWTHVGWLKAVDYTAQKQNKEEVKPGMEIIAYGSKGDKVAELQRTLQELGYDIGGRTGADGIFGKTTQAAVEQYQRDRGLQITGVWDDLSQQALLCPTKGNSTGINDIANRMRSMALELNVLAKQLSV